MFLNFFLKLKESRIPVSLNEFLTFLSALNSSSILYNFDNFYFLARSILIKDEKLLDTFDVIFGKYFNSIEVVELENIIQFLKVPNYWLEKFFQRNFSNEEIKKIKAFGNFEKLIKEFQKRIKKQKKKHTGGNKWIGTSGTSHFGAYGFNPEGIRIGQRDGRNNRAIKIWEKRIFKDFDNSVELNNRGFKVVLKKLRQWSRTGNDEELNLDETIKYIARNGIIEIKKMKTKENSINLLLFLDVGGSMDIYVKQVESLFSVAKHTFKNLEYFYFHNCMYEHVWKENSRRWNKKYSTQDILNTYGREYKCIFLGDASMSPYEIMLPGAGIEHYNKESGKVWLERIVKKWPYHLWINPIPKENWDYTKSITLVRNIFRNRMVPLNLDGLNEGMKILKKENF